MIRPGAGQIRIRVFWSDPDSVFLGQIRFFLEGLIYIQFFLMRFFYEGWIRIGVNSIRTQNPAQKDQRVLESCYSIQIRFPRGSWFLRRHRGTSIRDPDPFRILWGSIPPKLQLRISPGILKQHIFL